MHGFGRKKNYVGKFLYHGRLNRICVADDNEENCSPIANFFAINLNQNI